VIRKPIAFVGTGGRLRASQFLSTKTAFASVGLNTGNLAFHRAAWSILSDEKLLVPFDFDPTFVRERARLICLPAANFLYAGFDLGAFADRLQKTRLPLMVFGLGAQAMHDVAEVHLPIGTERLLHLFAERCERIAIRGEYTASVLERYGVKNFEVTGCPSNFLNPDRHLGLSILDRWRAGKQQFSFAPTLDNHYRVVELEIFRAIKKQIAEIIVQDPLQAVAYARGDRNRDCLEWMSNKAGFLSALPPDQKASAAAKLRAYFCADAWMEAYRAVDAEIGTRIHAASLAWQAGRAALIVSCDLRTEELANTMSLPMVKAGEVDATTLLAAMDQQVERCAELFDKRRSVLASRMCELMRDHSAEPSSALCDLASEELAGAA